MSGGSSRAHAERAHAGVIGVGNIGKAVTGVGRVPLECECSATDIVEIDHAFVAETGIEMTDLADASGPK